MKNDLGFLNTFDTLHWKSELYLNSQFIDYLCHLNPRFQFTKFYGCNDELCMFTLSDEYIASGVWTTVLYYYYDNGSILSDTFLLGNNQDFIDKANSFYGTYVFAGANCSLGTDFVSRVNSNSNYYEDLKNSSKPSEIIISCLYIFIPVLLFIIGLKVFKKGLFR